MGEKMGYYTADGKVGALIPFEHRAAISADFWTDYDRDAERIAFFSPGPDSFRALRNTMLNERQYIEKFQWKKI